MVRMLRTNPSFRYYRDAAPGRCAQKTGVLTLKADYFPERTDALREGSAALQSVNSGVVVGKSDRLLVKVPSNT